MHHTYWNLFRVFKLGPDNPAYKRNKTSFGLRSATLAEGGCVIPKYTVVLQYGGKMVSGREASDLQKDAMNPYIMDVYDEEVRRVSVENNLIILFITNIIKLLFII